MRPTSPPELVQIVSDFLEGVAVLPNWIVSSAHDRPGRGHYEWGNWSDTMREKHLWMLGGPWRTIVADVKRDGLIHSVINYHKLKDQMVWEIVEQTYCRAELARQSIVTGDTVKTRIRSVFSWQRRHDTRKHSLIWFIDFAFTLLAYSQFQAHKLFSDPSISTLEFDNIIPQFSPAEFGKRTIHMENQMLSHSFLPFYCSIPTLSNDDVLAARTLATYFCEDYGGLPPPVVDMDGDVRETRGMPREEKAVDFMSPWLTTMERPEHQVRWDSLINNIIEYEGRLARSDSFKAELCRAIVASLLIQLSVSDTADAGYVCDIAASTAVEQSERELLVQLRLVGLRRKKTVSRRTLRSDLEAKLKDRATSSPPPLRRYDYGGSSSTTTFQQHNIGNR